MKYSLNRDEPPILAETLWLFDPDAALEGDDGWIIAPDGASFPFPPPTLSDLVLRQVDHDLAIESLAESSLSSTASY